MTGAPDIAALLAWYRRHRRRMPWREQVDPYRTLVSELMLQQTRVDTVIPYFERFMARFPTVGHLAAAPLDEVLQLWAGLGYYSRARNLHRAAQMVVERGGFPGDVAGLRALPGVGPYTAGAVASIALGVDAPLVDGNVERVLARLFAWEDPPAALHRKAWERAAALLPAGEAGDYNQALMELGAVICTPQRPSCLVCPVRPGCLGVAAPERYPPAVAKAAVPEHRAAALVDRRGAAVLLGRRPDRGLLGGLWEPPLVGLGAAARDPASAAEALAARLGGPVDLRAPLGRVRHVFSHLALTVEVWEGRVEGEPVAGGAGAGGRGATARLFPPYQALGWQDGERPLSTLARKLLAAGAEGTPARLALTRSRRSPSATRSS
jgi:A/G-specific adenine glycosylase